MLIWNFKDRVIYQNGLPDRCRVCNEPGVFHVIMQRMFHFFWIPTIPLKKNSFVLCLNCGAQLHDTTYSCQDVKAKTPLWSFLGLSVIAILLSIGIFIETHNMKELADFKESPKADAFITFKVDSSYYYARVIKVADGRVYLDKGTYGSSKNVGLDKFVKDAQKDPTNPKYMMGKEFALKLKDFQSLDIQSVYQPETPKS